MRRSATTSRPSGSSGTHLLYFAGWKKHVSIYPVPAGDAALAKAVEPFREARGTLKFPHNQPLPLELVPRLVAAPPRRDRRAPGRRHHDQPGHVLPAVLPDHRLLGTEHGQPDRGTQLQRPLARMLEAQGLREVSRPRARCGSRARTPPARPRIALCAHQTAAARDRRHS